MSEYPENEPPDEQPELKPKGRSLSVFQAWLQVLAAPSTASFYVLLDDPRASLWRALRWLFLSAALGLFAIILLVQVILGSINTEWIPAALLICLHFGFLFTLSIAFFTSCVNFISRMMGGTGTFGEQLYTFAAFFPPLYFIEIGVALLTNQPIFFIAIRVYRILLIALAVRAVHRMTWWKTAAAVAAGTVISLALGGMILSF